MTDPALGVSSRLGASASQAGDETCHERDMANSGKGRGREASPDSVLDDSMEANDDEAEVRSGFEPPTPSPPAPSPPPSCCVCDHAPSFDGTCVSKTVSSP